MSQKLEIGEPELKRRGWKPRRLIEIDSSDDETDNENVPESVKNHYKKIYLESYGLVCECLTNRFEQEGLKNENLQEVLVLAAGKKNYDEKLKEILDFYTDDFEPDNLKSQLKVFTLSLIHISEPTRPY